MQQIHFLVIAISCAANHTARVFWFFQFSFFSFLSVWSFRWSLALYLLPYLPPLSVVPHFTFLLLLSIRLFDSLTCSLSLATSFSFSYLCSLSRPSSPFFLSTSLVSLSLFICFSPHTLLLSSTFLSVSLFLSVISLRFFLISPKTAVPLARFPSPIPFSFLFFHFF